MAKWERWNSDAQNNSQNGADNGYGQNSGDNSYSQNNGYYSYNGYNGNGNNDNNGRGDEDYAFRTVMNNGRRKTLGWSVASLVLGILSVVCCCLGYAGALFAVGAIVFAIVARRTLGYFDGLAIAGLVLGIFGAVFSISAIISTMLIPPEFWEEYYQEFENGTLPGGDI